MNSVVGYNGHFESGNSAPHDLGNSYHNAKFKIIDYDMNSNKYRIRIHVSNGFTQYRWIPIEVICYYTDFKLGSIEPLKRITKFRFI